MLLDQHIRAIAFFGVLVVDQGVVESVHVTGSLPDRRVHEDG